MDADEARAAVAPGGPLEFVHAGGVIEVPLEHPTLEGQMRGALVTACDHGRPTLIVSGAKRRRAVLISYDRYMDLLHKAGEFAEPQSTTAQALDALAAAGVPDFATGIYWDDEAARP